MIIATAGHIDHGKTRLVKALTGCDTDRLPQERARGISIDLGFAHLDLGETRRVSFIDVPGHERFIRNMIAGVCGIDAALAVVAADDGIMPQTLEHIHILDLLGVRRGAVAVTKTDLVAPTRVAQVIEEIKRTLADTSLANVPVFPLSVVSGRGVGELAEWVKSLASRQECVETADHYFRMPVDRAFTIAGSGTVVTGTVHAGSISVGDRLIVSPGGQGSRVRGIQAHGMAVQAAVCGQRCALNLAGISFEQVVRGDWVLHPDVHGPTERLDVRLRLLAGASHPLEHRTRVHLHHGTASVSARILLPRAGAIMPGEVGFAQLLTDKPIAALHADPFILRSQNTRHTIAGGMVLDPYGSARKRRGDLRVAELQVYERGHPSRILAGLLELSEGGISLQEFMRAMNLVPPAAIAARRAAGAVSLGRVKPMAISRTAAEALTAHLMAALGQFHQQNPQADGMEVAILHKNLAPRMPPGAFRAFVRNMADRKLLVLSNDIARLRNHVASSNPEDNKLWARVHAVLRDCGIRPPTLAELAAQLGCKEQVLRDFLHRKSRSGLIWRVSDTRFCLQETLMQLAAMAVALAAGKDDGFFLAADFRDVIGTGRGLAIHYLEFFDRLGITSRAGDRRRIAKDYLSVLDPGGTHSGRRDEAVATGACL